jgi:hypothetical protein
MTMIMAMDEFDFYYKLNNKEDMEDKITKQKVHKTQAIAFINELFHAGGSNKTDEYKYHLFAYITSNHVDFPLGTVFTGTKSNPKKLEDVRKTECNNGSVKVTGRVRKQPDHLIPRKI